MNSELQLALEVAAAAFVTALLCVGAYLIWIGG